MTPNEIIKYVQENNVKIYVFNGASGTGKSTLAKMLTKTYEIPELISTTSRAIRAGEIQGNSYHFISNNDFFLLKENNGFAESTNYDESNYGLTWKEIENKVTNKTKIITVVLDDVGVKALKNIFGKDSVKSIFLHAPLNVLENRMIERGDSIDSVKKRLKNAETSGELDIEYKSKIHDFSFFNGLQDSSIFNLYELFTNEICKYINYTDTVKNDITFKLIDSIKDNEYSVFKLLFDTYFTNNKDISKKIIELNKSEIEGILNIAKSSKNLDIFDYMIDNSAIFKDVFLKKISIENDFIFISDFEITEIDGKSSKIDINSKLLDKSISYTLKLDFNENKEIVSVKTHDGISININKQTLKEKIIKYEDTYINDYLHRLESEINKSSLKLNNTSFIMNQEFKDVLKKIINTHKKTVLLNINPNIQFPELETPIDKKIYSLKDILMIIYKDCNIDSKIQLSKKEKYIFSKTENIFLTKQFISFVEKNDMFGIDIIAEKFPNIITEPITPTGLIVHYIDEALLLGINKNYLKDSYDSLSKTNLIEGIIEKYKKILHDTCVKGEISKAQNIINICDNFLGDTALLTQKLKTEYCNLQNFQDVKDKIEFILNDNENIIDVNTGGLDEN